jgi:glycosyltransferase involved in cell wall biosynthesis
MHKKLFIKKFKLFFSKIKKKLSFFFYPHRIKRKLLLFLETNGLKKSDNTYKFESRIISKKLWAGFSINGLGDLLKLKNSQTAIDYQKMTAAIHLAKWYAYKNDYEKALDNILFAKKHSNKTLLSIVMMHSEILNQLGRYHEARSILQPLMTRSNPGNHVLLMYANTYNHPGNQEKDSEILRNLNNIFEKSNLLPIKKISETKSLNFSNITSNHFSEFVIDQEPKISVIMPAHNAESTIGVAIQSLINQTWRNLELLIVDDLSTDSTYEIISDFAKKDDRVIPIKHTKNLGAYGARNTGLYQASGEYITINDSDDWAHPQKLEIQIQSMLSDGSTIANTSNLIRVSEDLYFFGAWIIGKDLIRENRSSLLFHRSFIHFLGGWDMVRVSADSEFIERIKHIFGPASIKNILPAVPLTFCLDLSTNLTKKSDSHLKTLYFGKRGDYTEIAKWWRNHTIIPHLKLDPTSEKRPFQIPDNIKINPIGHRIYDYAIFTDFCPGNEFFTDAKNFIIESIKAGKKVAIFHYPDYEKFNDYRQPLQDQIYELINNQSIDRISIGEFITCKSIFFFKPELLIYPLDEIPNITFQNLYMISEKQDFSFDENKVKINQTINISHSIQKLFKKTAAWISVSDLTNEI